LGAGKCSTPLNNPFITDIVSSSYPLPNGLSATHEHQELLDVFLQGNASTLLQQNDAVVLMGGLPLYRQVLDNAHKGNVPIDFVEIPKTQDIIYITETTIGMINSKGMMLMDIYNPGYCRAIDTILCPPGYFGSVGGVCKSCIEDQSQDEEVSAQIQCAGLVTSSRRRRRLLSVFQSAPYTQVSMVVSNTVQKNDIDTLMRFYLIAHGYNCTEASAMSGYQPYNMAADLQDAGAVIKNDNQCTQLIPCMIESAGDKMKRNLSLAIPEEYLISWTLQNSSLVNALTKRSAQTRTSTIDRGQASKCGLSIETVDTLEKSKCMVWINSDFHNDWLPCALGVLNESISNQNVASNAMSRRRRHLLQESSTTNTKDMLVIPLAQGTFMSSTTISWGVLSKPTTPTSPSNTKNQNESKNDADANNNNNMFLFIIVFGVIAGLLVTVLIVGIIYMYFIRSKRHRMITRTGMMFPSSSSNHTLYLPLKNY
jgi:hypothetical protein